MQTTTRSSRGLASRRGAALLLATCALAGVAGVRGQSGDTWGWTAGSLDPNVTSTLHDLYVVKYQGCAYAVGEDDTVLKSVDRGESWTAVNVSTGLGAGQHWYSVNFRNCTHGWVAGSGGAVMRTTDGARSWQQQPTPAADNSPPSAIRAVQIISGEGPQRRDDGEVVAVGERGLILRTADWGATWQAVPAPTQAELRAVRFPEGPLEGWAAAADGSMLHTTDGGLSWLLQDIDANLTQGAAPQRELTALSFSTDPSTRPPRGLAVGLAGALLQSQGAGNVTGWRRGSGCGAGDMHAVDVDGSTGYGFAVGARGFVCWTWDHGATWRHEEAFTAEGGTTLRAVQFWGKGVAASAIGDGGLIFTFSSAPPPPPPPPPPPAPEDKKGKGKKKDAPAADAPATEAGGEGAGAEASGGHPVFAVHPRVDPLGSEFLYVPLGAAHLGVYSLTTGCLAREMPLPGLPSEHGGICTLRVMPAHGDMEQSSRMLAVAVTGSLAVHFYSINDALALTTVMDRAGPIAVDSADDEEFHSDTEAESAGEEEESDEGEGEDDDEDDSGDASDSEAGDSDSESEHEDEEESQKVK